MGDRVRAGSRAWGKRGWLAVLSVGAGLGAATWLPAGAGADIPFTLSLAGPSSPVSGQPFAITASGTSPTDQGPVYLDVYEIPASFATTCPASYLDAGQLAGGSGGQDVAFYDRESPDASGNFSMPLAFTPSAPGGYLFCGYTDDEATDTLAQATLLENVVAPPSSGSGGGNGGTGGTGSGGTGAGGGNPGTVPPAKPAETARPRITRTGAQLVCSRGSWTGAATFAYAWLVNGHLKRGAHKTRLAVGKSLKGRSVACQVTASNSAGNASATSRPLRVH